MKHSYLAAKIFFGLSAVLLGLMTYWLVFPYKPLVINERPTPILNKRVKHGGVLQYKLNYCKANDGEVLIRRKFTDGLEFAMPDVITSSNRAGCRQQVIGLEIPKGLPTGRYILTMEFVYKVNPIRNMTIRAHTEVFEVIE